MIVVDFDKNFVKNALAYNYGCSVDKIRTKDFSSDEIADSIGYYLQSGKYADRLSSVSAVRKNNVMRIDLEGARIDKNGEKIRGSEYAETLLYNSGVIDLDEIGELIDTGRYLYDERLVVTTPDRADLLSTTILNVNK